MKIAVDAMGGDFAPCNIVAGAVDALREQDCITRLFLVGDSARIEALLATHIDGFKETILARRAYSPADLQKLNINLEGGDPYGGQPLAEDW